MPAPHLLLRFASPKLTPKLYTIGTTQAQFTSTYNLNNRTSTTTHFRSSQTTVIMPKEAKPTRVAKKAGKVDGGRKKKDPNQPKRGLSAYMFFANEQRETVRSENPGIKFGDVGKLLGLKWKELSEKQKQPYEDKAARDKKRYEEEKAAYTATADDDE